MRTIWTADLSTASGPKYAALAASIRRAIQSGTLDEGARLPPVRQLAETMSVTPGTVARAYSELTGEGVLRATVGRGTYVAPREKPYPSEPYLLAPTAPGEVNLRTTRVPEVGQGPLIVAAMHRAVTDSGWTLYPNAAEGRELSEALLAFSSGVEIGPADWTDVVPTMGAQHAITLVMQTALKGTRPRVVVDELTYPGYRHAAGLARAEVSCLPWDEEGPVPEAFEAACRMGGVQLYCTSSEVHNPTTARTSDARRSEIVAVARRHDVQILDDDCFISGTGQDAPLYRGLAPERVWHIGSFSKRLSPALRFGFIVAPEGRGREARLALQQQAFGLPVPLTATALDLVRSGAAQEIKDRVRAANRRMVGLAREALAGFDIRSRDEIPMIWLTMPRGWRASTFEAAAKERGILVRAADTFALPDGKAPNAVRVALNGSVPDETLGGALGTIAATLSSPPFDLEV